MNQKNQKGITLIALVVTIIILLILAGVTINMVLGNDGIIEQAQQAKLAQIDEQIKEELEIWKAEKEIEARGGEKARTEKQFFEDLYEKELIDDPDVEELKDRNGIILYQRAKEMITFKLEGVLNEDRNYEYQAEKGMTWSDWINSEYNIVSDEIVIDNFTGEQLIELRKLDGYEWVGKCLFYDSWCADAFYANGGFIIHNGLGLVQPIPAVAEGRV